MTATVQGLAARAYSTIFDVALLALLLNVLVAIMSAPAIVVLVTTDPARSWPVLAPAAALAAPGLAAAFGVLGAPVDGARSIARAFRDALRRTWRRALAVGAACSVVVTVALVDVAVLASSELAVLVVPLLLLVSVLAIAAAAIALVVIAQHPEATLRTVVGSSLHLAVRRPHLVLVTLVAFGTQAAVFASMPALAIGVTAAPTLYIAWANARRALALLRPTPHHEEHP